MFQARDDQREERENQFLTAGSRDPRPEPSEGRAVTKTGSRNEQGIIETLDTRFIVVQRRDDQREERENQFLTAG